MYIYKYKYTYALGVPRRNFDVVYHDGFSKIHRVQGLKPISIPLFWVARAAERAATGRVLNPIRDAVQEARKYWAACDDCANKENPSWCTTSKFRRGTLRQYVCICTYIHICIYICTNMFTYINLHI